MSGYKQVCSRMNTCWRCSSTSYQSLRGMSSKASQCHSIIVYLGSGTESMIVCEKGRRLCKRRPFQPGPDRLNDGQGHVDIATGGVRVWADDVGGGNQLFSGFAVQTWQRDFQLNFDAETGRDPTDADGAFNR